MHSVAEDELLCSDAVDPIHELLFVQEEPLQSHVEAVAGGYTGFVKLVQLLHDYSKRKKCFRHYFQFSPCLPISMCRTPKD